MTNLEGLAAGITIAILFGMGIFAGILTWYSRRRETNQEEKAEEEGRLEGSPKQASMKQPQLPLFKTRSSLSMSPTSPYTSKTPGIQFTITTPSQRSRTRGSIDSLPSVETILEQYGYEADTVGRHNSSESDRMLKDEDLGEPGPSIDAADVSGKGKPLA